ncbi:hypothetical protein FQR65_LT00893 [Abscondita terminalis]|nr:hypothetical protein FQR65_LT00893 [Abscondita terminalis]
MENSSGSEEFENDEGIDKQLMFFHKLKEHKILLNKSQVPQVKLGKEAALKVLVPQYKDIFNISLTTKQLSKKISNMKVEIKKKFDVNKTGNKPMVFKPWEKLFLEMLDVQNNPVFKKIPGAISAGADEQISLDKPSTASSDLPIPAAAACTVIPTKKVKISYNLPETDETKKLSTAELQRLVLLEQLKLCRMQQEEIRKRQQWDNGLLQSTNIVSNNDTFFYNL